MVERVWQGGENYDSVLSLKQKLNRMASSLAQWGQTTFGHVRLELRELQKKLGLLKSGLNRQGPSYEEKKIEARITELNYREEIMWRQSSRIQWLAEGDGNTKFFTKINK